MRKLNIILAAATFFWQSAFGQTTGSRGPIQYFFINGVSTSAYANRQNSADAIFLRLKASGTIDAAALGVDALPNPSQGLFSDIFQKLVVQKQIELGGDFKSAVMQTVQMVDGDPGYTPPTQDLQVYNEALGRIAALTEANTTYTSVIQPTLQAMVSTVIASMQNNHPVVIVAHSEGNMYANEIDSIIRNSAPPGSASVGLPDFAQWIKIVGVATPAGSAPDGLYGTIEQDDVITVLAQALSAVAGFQAPLPANMSFPGAHQYDWLGHGFVPVYLNRALDTQNQIPALVGTADAALQSGGPVGVFAGDVTGLPPSGRFAVRMPDGSLVYPGGDYIATADHLEVGTYQFGAVIGQQADCSTGSWQASIDVLSVDAPNGQGGLGTGGGFGGTCQPGVFAPLTTVTVAADAGTGGFVVSAQ